MGLASIVSSAVGALGSIGGTAYSARHAEAAARKAREYGIHMAQNKYQYAVKDLRKAGLNPMLATSLGGTAAPPGPVAPGVSSSNPGASAVEARQRSLQTELLAQQVDQSKSVESLNKVLAVKAGEEARLTGANADQAEVMKAVYQSALPLVEEAQKWINSAQQKDGWLEGLYNTLRNSAADAFYELDPAGLRSGSRKPTRGPQDSYRLAPVKVSP